MFPFTGPMAAEAVEEEEISCVSGEGLALPRRHLIYRNLLRFGSRAASSKIGSFYRTSLVKVLIEVLLRLRAVTGRMCLLKRANLPGAILTKLFSKIRCFGGVCCNMPI